MQNHPQTLKKIITQLFFIVFICFTLTDCGFHLRGDEMIPPQMRVLYLASPNPYDPFIVQLRNSMKSKKIVITDTPQQALLTLQILNVAFNQRLTSMSANTQVRTYVLSYDVSFQLINAHGQVIYGPIIVESSMSYNTSDTQLLGDTQQLNMKKKQMLQDIVVKIFDRINSEQGRQALQQVL
jgi:LPS-assembly lipoprotein